MSEGPSDWIVVSSGEFSGKSLLSSKSNAISSELRPHFSIARRHAIMTISILMIRSLLLTLALTLPSLPLAGQTDGNLDLYWIDSEGGGSTLMVTPAGESILIDTGNPEGRDPQRTVWIRGRGLYA